MGGNTGHNGATGIGAITRWTKERQPEDGSKARGWAKRRKGRELLQLILERNFDPKNASGEFKEKMAQFYDLPIEDITNEAALLFAQVTQAIAKGDTYAFNAIMDRAYGKPKEVVELRPVEDAMQQLSDEQLLQQLNTLTAKLNGQSSTGTSSTNSNGVTETPGEGGI